MTRGVTNSSWGILACPPFDRIWCGLEDVRETRDKGSIIKKENYPHQTCYLWIIPIFKTKPIDVKSTGISSPGGYLMFNDQVRFID